MPSRAMKRVKKAMKKEAAPRQACTLEGGLWIAWCDHLLRESSTWLYVLTILCHMFCLRVTEGLRLKASDFSWETRSVRVGSLKRAPEVHKKITSAYLPLLRRLRKEGKGRRRSKPWGALGKRNFTDKWEWPNGEEYLFPNRTGTSYTKKANVRKSFKPPAGCSLGDDVRQVRSHSARHRKINDMKASSASPEEGMTFARIKRKKTYDRYGKISQHQAGEALQRNKKLQKALKSLYAKA
ncbi:unnamed protein product [Durusdinium trenchii]|uniref:Tyr recombinase domain-containing protein n=1 Tax=Durusdinium trenchii TaxID=1381693 RepID=A0ABP0JNU0_9DINO